MRTVDLKSVDPSICALGNRSFGIREDLQERRDTLKHLPALSPREGEKPPTVKLPLGARVPPTETEAPTLRSERPGSGNGALKEGNDGFVDDPCRPLALTMTERGPARDAPPHAERPHRALGPGSTFGTGGRFEILKLLGSGGMSWVFQARDRLLDRTVAAKFLRPDDDAAPDLLKERSIVEARVIAKLNHENIVRVLDIGIWRGLAYLILEHHEGVVLSDLLSAGPCSPERATGILVEIAQALDHVHRAGILHLDLKPHNVLVCRKRGIKLFDFGISAWHRSARMAASLMGSAQNELVGTPSYMAPEQWRAGKVDERTDLWAVGCLYHEMLFGTPPYGDHDPESARRFMLSRAEYVVPRANPGLPDLVAELVTRLLRHEPQERIASAAELLRALRRVTRHLRQRHRSPLAARPRASH